MPSDKPRFTVSRTYSRSNPADNTGDSIDHGYIFQDVTMSLEDTVRELSDCIHLSSSPIRNPEDVTPYMWAFTEPEEDYRTGINTVESVHIHGSSPSNLWRVYKLAGLIP